MRNKTNGWEMEYKNFVVVRVPFLPEDTIDILKDLNTSNNIISNIKYSLKQLLKLVKQANIVQAIEFASPTLAKNISNLNEDISSENLKLASSIYKYITRMSTRCTPFGAFSSVMTLPLKNGTSFHIQSEMRIFLRLDNSCVFSIARSVELNSIETKNDYLKVRKNSTICNFNKEIRFIGKKFLNEKYDFTLESVDETTEIKATLQIANNWITVKNLLSELILLFPDANKNTLRSFIFDLIENQLLETNLTIVVSSKNSLEALLKRSIESKTNPSYITGMSNILKILKTTKLMNDDKFNSNLLKLKLILKELIPNHDLIKWLHIDSFRDTESQTYGLDKVKPIVNTLKNLVDFFWEPNMAINEFTKVFSEIYGDTKVPLLKALDVENGIQFGPKRLGSSPLLKGVIPEPKKSSTNNLDWTGLDRYIMSKILYAISNNLSVAQIYSDRISKFKPLLTKPNSNITGSTSIHGLMLEEKGKPLFELRGVNGPSALTLFGRFCCGDYNLRNACKKIADEEQISNPDVIYAEIIHVPQSNIANISCRPNLRDYEIVYGLGDSSLPNEKQIRCEDLYLKIINERICLFSTKLKKEIKPRLASAHNSSGLNLPVYQFLHAMQSVDGYFTGIKFNAVYYGLPYVPEIRIDDVIISKQRWVITAKEIYQLIQCKTIEEKLELFQEYKKMKQLTRYVDLSEGDNILEFDLESNFTTLLFVNEVIKRGKTVIVFKSIKGLSDPSVCQNKLIYRNEVIIPCSIKNTNKTGKTHINESIISNSEQRELSSLPSEKWKYMKIYTGEASADKLISRIIAPILENLIKRNLIENWHFIRYLDPDYHLRIRLKLNDDFRIDTINLAINKAIKPLYQHGLINKITEESYIPEVKRYGGIEIIPICEKLFYLNSLVVTNFINETNHFPNKNDLRWQLCLRLAWKITYSACSSLEEMEVFFKKHAKLYDVEFNSNSAIKKQLSSNYRKSTSAVLNSLSPTSSFPSNKLFDEGIYLQYSEVINKLKTLCVIHKKDILQITQSIIHMDCNRIFIMNPRMNEWIIYHYLAKYIRTVIARKLIPNQDVLAGFDTNYHIRKL